MLAFILALADASVAGLSDADRAALASVLDRRIPFVLAADAEVEDVRRVASRIGPSVEPVGRIGGASPFERSRFMELTASRGLIPQRCYVATYEARIAHALRETGANISLIGPGAAIPSLANAIERLSAPYARAMLEMRIVLRAAMIGDSLASLPAEMH